MVLHPSRTRQGIVDLILFQINRRNPIAAFWVARLLARISQVRGCRAPLLGRISTATGSASWGCLVSTGQLSFGIASRGRARYSAGVFTNANKNNTFALAA